MIKGVLVVGDLVFEEGLQDVFFQMVPSFDGAKTPSCPEHWIQSLFHVRTRNEGASLGAVVVAVVLLMSAAGVTGFAAGAIFELRLAVVTTL